MAGYPLLPPTVQPQVRHHGAVDGVTGSCHEYRVAADYGVLIDCGLFQGDEQAPHAVPQTAGGLTAARHEAQAVTFAIAHIKAVILTHVHIDHVGRLPYLMAAGYTGPIYCSEASAVLLPLVLEDALKVGVTRDPQLIAGFLRAIKRQLVPCGFNRWVSLPAYTVAAATPANRDVTSAGVGNVAFRLQRAGHILGSAYVEIKQKIAGYRPFVTVFSGDLGAPYAPLLPAPKPPYAADLLVIESTYGHRRHENRKQRSERLQRMLVLALQNNGTVVFPAFSIGRTQELLYELEAIIYRLQQHKIHCNLRWGELNVIVDSPLAAKFNLAYQQLAQYWDAEARQRVAAGRHPLSFAQLHTVDTHAEHVAVVNMLAATKRPAIVIAASGMCEGGRVVNYLKALLPDPAHQVVFIGYQAKGTLGAAIERYGPRGGYVVIDKQPVTIRAGVATLSGYSAHADQTGLIRFVTGMKRKPMQIRIVHGDETAKKVLSEEFIRRGLAAVIPTQ